MVQNREPNPCNIDPKRPGHIDTGTLDVESNWPCEFKNMLIACFRTDSTRRPTFKKVLSALDKMLQVGVDKPSSSSSHRMSQKSTGNTCTSGNGSNVSNVSNVSTSSVEFESIADSKLTPVSMTNTDTNDPQSSREEGKRSGKWSFKDKYIMPLVNRFSAAMSTHSSRDSLSESSEQRCSTACNGSVKPEQSSATTKDQFDEYIPFEASVSGRGSSLARSSCEVNPSPPLAAAAAAAVSVPRNVSSQIMPKSKRDKLSDSILSVLTTGSSHRSKGSGNNIVNRSSDNSIRRSQRYDAFSSPENVDLRSGPSLLNVQLHAFGLDTSRPLNVSRNGSQSTLQPMNAQSNNSISRTTNHASPTLNKVDEQYLSFADSITPGNLYFDTNTLFAHISQPISHMFSSILSCLSQQVTIWMFLYCHDKVWNAWSLLMPN